MGIIPLGLEDDTSWWAEAHHDGAGTKTLTPEDLANRHPRLYHVTERGAYASIVRHGLLSTSRLLTLFEVAPEQRPRIEATRRERSVCLPHPIHGKATITDNRPLSIKALASCLDDGFTPGDWLRILNARVFFWCDEISVTGLLQARLNRCRPKDVLVFDTLRLVRSCPGRVELSAINSGATLRRPARRGPKTFVPLQDHSYEEWRNLRGKRDKIREVTVTGGIIDIQDYVVEVRKFN